MGMPFWTNVKAFCWHSRGVLITTPIVAGVVILIRLSGVLQAFLEWPAYDLYLRLRLPENRDRQIVIVGIDENDINHLQESIIPDEILAKLLEKLKARQPRAIGLDMYRDFPVPPGHEHLVKVFESTPNLIGIEKVAGEAGRETVAGSKILKQKGQIGANDFVVDADNHIRRGFFYLSNGQENVYSFGLMLAAAYLEKEGIIPQGIPHTDNWRIGKTIFVPFESNDGGYIRADARGFQILINYRGGNKTFDTVSMTDILEDRVPPDWGRDRIILIGKVGESFKDVFLTPYSSILGLSQAIPGVEIHANLASQIINSAMNGRPLIQTLPDPLEGLWILIWSGIGAVISWQFRYREGMQKSIIFRVGLFVIGGSALFIITYIAILWGWWLPMVPAFLALFGSVIAVTAYLARTGIEIRKTFGRYLTDEVVANLLENPAGLKIGGERRKITILTSDLRGFTATAERLQPEQVIRILNFYFGKMSDVISKYQGTIDEFMGDGILVLFGAPTYRDDDAQRAIACAIEMQLAMTTVNEQMKLWELNPLAMGIGINTGEVIVGNIGSEKRTKYGIVGNQVNLTYRIESYTTAGQILISETTYQEAKELVSVNGCQQVQAKGIQQPITIYDLRGIKSPYNLELWQETESFYSLPEVIPLQYCLLAGKHIDGEKFIGNLVQLSANGAKIHCQTNLSNLQGDHNRIPSHLTNIKINLLSEDINAQISEDIYAKVIDRPANPDCFFVYFTAKPPAIEAHFQNLYERLKNSA